MLPAPGVSQDAALVTLAEGRVTIHNTSKRPNLLVSYEFVAPGSSRTLKHGDAIAIGGIPGFFLDGRYQVGAPATSADALSGMLSREGLACEVGLAMAARRRRTLFLAHFGNNQDGQACAAIQVLHQREPDCAVGRIGPAAAVLVETVSDMQERLRALQEAKLTPLASGWLDLEGPSVEAVTRVDAALGALTRIAAAGGNSQAEDLARYAVSVVPVTALANLAQNASAAGGGVGLFVLDELERYGALGEAANAVIDLEFREMLGSKLGPSDRVAHVAQGVMAVVTHQSVDRVLRDATSSWRAVGAIDVGALEIERSVSSFELDTEGVQRLIRDGEAFTRELLAGGEALAYPLPIAYWLDVARRAESPAARAHALVQTTENLWRVVAYVLVRASWSMGKKARIGPIQGSGWADPWRTLALQAANVLAGEDGKVERLASTLLSAFQSGTGPLAVATEQAVALSALLAGSSPDPSALVSRSRALGQALSDALRTLRPLRGWSLVSIHHLEPLDVSMRVLRVDFADHTGPEKGGFAQQHTVVGLPLAHFVYMVRWAEALAVALEPFVRVVRMPGKSTDELVLIEVFPTGPGAYPYRAVTDDTRIELSVTAKQLT